MSPVTTLPTTDTWTVDDLDALPDDGLRYELADGVLLVSPAPRLTHQRVLKNLLLVLGAACPPELEVVPAPFDYRPTRRRSFQPDLLVARRADLEEDAVRVAPLLVVEVLSPSTRLRDLTLKRAAYAEGGVASYWLVDPHEPSLTVLRLRDGGYVEAAAVRGEEGHRALEPLAVTVVPAALIR